MFNKSRRLLLAALVFLFVLPTTAVVGRVSPGLPLQVDLGDSWTFGEGASDPADTGYAGIVYESNRSGIDCVPAQVDRSVDGCRNLERFILARPGTPDNPGVTTDRLISEQLDRAVELIARRNGDANPANDVEVVLLSVGGNDVSGPVLQACLTGLTPACVGVITERVGHVYTNLGTILGSLRTAAGPESRIVITTYDNAIAHCPLAEVPGAVELGDLVLEGNSTFGITGLNDVIRSRAAEYGITVADVYGRLDAGQWVGDCLHPNQAGHTEIGEIVIEASHA